MALRRKRDTKLDATAKRVGRRLGQAAGRIDRLNRQRADLIQEIRDVIDAAQDMLADLGDTAAITRRRLRQGARQLKRRRRQASKRTRAKKGAARRKRAKARAKR